MISVNDFKNGLTIEVDGDLWRIVEFQHVKPGKGSAFVRSTLKNLRTVPFKKKRSAQLKKLKRRKLTARTCNTCMPMGTIMSSWIPILMTN